MRRVFLQDAGIRRKGVSGITSQGAAKKTVTAAEANRQFSRELRDIGQGEVFTVLLREKAVATIAPAKAALLECLHKLEAGG